MTCAFGNHSGRRAKVTIPGFDGKSMSEVIEICEQDQKILESGMVKK